VAAHEPSAAQCRVPQDELSRCMHAVWPWLPTLTTHLARLPARSTAWHATPHGSAHASYASDASGRLACPCKQFWEPTDRPCACLAACRWCRAPPATWPCRPAAPPATSCWPAASTAATSAATRGPAPRPAEARWRRRAPAARPPAWCRWAWAGAAGSCAALVDAVLDPAGWRSGSWLGEPRGIFRCW
jgi:hypothetical protein